MIYLTTHRHLSQAGSGSLHLTQEVHIAECMGYYVLWGWGVFFGCEFKTWFVENDDYNLGMPVLPWSSQNECAPKLWIEGSSLAKKKGDTPDYSSSSESIGFRSVTLDPGSSDCGMHGICHSMGLDLKDETPWSHPWRFGSNVLKSGRVLPWLRSTFAFWFWAIVF